MKHVIYRVKRQAREWDGILVTHITKRALVSRKYFELGKSMRKKSQEKTHQTLEWTLYMLMRIYSNGQIGP